MQIIRTIIVIVLAFYVFRFIGRIVVPFIVKMLFNKAQKDFQNQQSGHEPSREKGDVKVEGKQKKDEPKGDDDGEYVDFEEID
jgi:hypothetical protein